MNADGGAGELSPRFYSVVPVALGFFYGYWRLREAGPELKELERRFRASRNLLLVRDDYDRGADAVRTAAGLGGGGLG